MSMQFYKQTDVLDVVKQWGKECLDDGVLTSSDAIMNLIYRLCQMPKIAVYGDCLLQRGDEHDG